ncbi:MAG: leucyl aminopeptidase, partial [Bacteroidota bacterium]|nr:leucyl aminopeptidase [Bacteroidota bacterium]
HTTISTVKHDALAVFFSQEKSEHTKLIEMFPSLLRKKIESAIELNEFTGKENGAVTLYTESVIASPRLLLIGIGELKKLTLEKFRRAAATAATYSTRLKASSLAIVFPHQATNASLSSAEISQAIVEGAVLSQYKFDKYRKPDNEKKKLRGVAIISSSSSTMREIERGVTVGRILCEAVYHARDLENAPSNEIYPETLARYAQQAGRKYGFGVTVFDKRKIESLKMGGIIGVSKGSENPPRFIILEHNRNAKKSGTAVLVGKGVTFDTGGISIKPSASMAEMKMDMSGAGAVIGTFEAAAQLKIPVHLVGLIPAVENMPSGSAIKPGDIIRHYNGTTSEVDNTDAEGRLILADALGYASNYKPELAIDLATLTGACVVALGHLATGMMGNDNDLMNKLKEAGEKTYERVWQLPLFDEYEKQIKSDVADVKNVGGRWAGAITAGWFLKKFIGDYKWIHLDIAGTAILEEALDYAPKGGSGVGVRLLVEFLQNRKKS